MADISLSQRTQDACDQLTRYGGGVFSAELADLLDVITDINDDLWHGRHEKLIREGVERARKKLVAIAREASTNG